MDVQHPTVGNGCQHASRNSLAFPKQNALYNRQYTMVCTKQHNTTRHFSSYNQGNNQEI